MKRKLYGWLNKQCVVIDGDKFTHLDIIKACVVMLAMLFIIAIMGN